MKHCVIYTLLLLCEPLHFGTSTELSEIEIFREYCPSVKTCKDRDNETQHDATKGPSCCQSCTCDEYCWDRGNCCPDAPHPYRPRIVQCVPKKSYFNYFVVEKCAVRHSSINSMICESDEDPRLFEDAALVSDTNDSRVFRNRFCAECNGVMSYTTWKIASLNESSYSVCTNGKNALLDSVSRLEDCVFLSIRPNEEIHKNAICERENIAFWSDCLPSSNATVQWHYERCKKYRIPAFFNNLVNNESRIYRNVFCFVCKALQEGTDPELYKACDNGIIGQLGGTRYQATLPFRKIFSITEDGEKPVSTICAEDRLFDEYKKRCLEYSCAFGHVKQDGVCARNILESYHAKFRIQIEFTPAFNHLHVVASTDAKIYIKAAKELINSIRPCPFANEEAWVIDDREKEGSFVWEVDILTTYNCQDRDVKAIADYLRNNEVVVKDDVSSVFYYIKPVFSNLNVSIDLNRSNLDIDVNKIGLTSPIFELNAVTFCTAILLSANELNEFRDDITSHLDEQDDLLRDLENNLVYENDFFKICYNTYARIRKNLELSTSMRLSGSVGGYLSLICSLMSVICAGFTMVVNLIFDRSHRLPQYVLHIVCLNLILAQCMFQFGIGAEISGFPCILIGVLIHCLWLSHALAMSAFIFGVILTLRKRATNSVLSNWRIAVHVLYIYGVPLIFVALNIFVSKLTTDNKDVGYGEGHERLCYISTAFSRTVFFVIPLFTIVGLNMFCYIYFVWFMVKQRMDSEILRSQRLYIQAYARLSCVTGITWIFGLMSEFANLAVFEYLFILTNCGQGVFLFLAFGKIKNIYQSMKARAFASMASTEE